MELDSFSCATYYKEKLVNIYYTFIRPQREHNMADFMMKYEELLCSLHNSIKKAQKEQYGNEIEKYIDALKMLYKLVAQTRDFSYGKGERDLTYMMIYVWWKYYPTMGMALLRSLICGERDFDDEFLLHIDCGKKYSPHVNSYGCFKDIKYFCNFVNKYGNKHKLDENEELCTYAMTILNQRVYDDYNEYCKNGTLPSLACKWVPRENSKYSWIFEKMAIQWAKATNVHILSSIDLSQYDGMNVSFKCVKAVTKCKMIYRKVISQLTRQLDLCETKQCNREWAEIDVSKITLDAMFRNSNSLFNIDGAFDYRENTIVNKDRRQCETNVKDHIYMNDLSPQMKLGKLRKSYVGQYTFTPMQFVKKALMLISRKNTQGNSNNIAQNIIYQIGLLNETWTNFVAKCNALDYFIPIIDMSLSMVQCDDAICNAIGMSCLIAEKSKIEHRIMVMDNIPTWVNLDGCIGNFVGMVETLYHYTTKNSLANLLKTMNTIVQSLSYSNDGNYFGGVFGKMELVFVIFTNETSFAKCENGLAHSMIVELFENAKLDIPHIVYWNCIASSAIEDVYVPVNGKMPKSSLVSGTNAELLNHFTFIGYENKYVGSPFDALENILSNSRYNIIGDLFDKYYDL